MTIGTTIKKLRTARGWSQQDLAIRLHTFPNVVSQWENEHTVPSLHNARAMSLVFGVTIEDIIGGELNNEDDS